MGLGRGRCRAEDWPQLQHDPQHSGHTEDPGPAQGRVLWEFDLNRELVGKCAQPIIVGGKVYLGSLGGVLRCFDASSGAVLWESRANAPIAHSPAAADGRVFCADLSGHVFGLDAAKGTELLAFDAGLPGFSAAVTVADGRLFLGRRGSGQDDHHHSQQDAGVTYLARSLAIASPRTHLDEPAGAWYHPRVGTVPLGSRGRPAPATLLAPIRNEGQNRSTRRGNTSGQPMEPGTVSAVSALIPSKEH
jgi:hypothetical protein